MPLIYPPTPKDIDDRIIQPSPAFKHNVFNVLGSIVFFILVYITLMAVAILLAMLCGYGGIMVIAAHPGFITIMIGLGLIGLGIMVIIFLLKFLFKSDKTDHSHLIEITNKDQPELFNFIHTLTTETQSPFPKKIYISADVNASVFYDSSFWSMFFPVRKNLQIGLGLVNAVNMSEFKAILAHEFGHFSQRSMKLGSYVYNVNKVIYNMLYDNEGYGHTLETWANINSYFAFFANLTSKIVQTIQWVLQKVYGIVNKNYLSLSRQMEFHADAVSAYVSGSDHLVTSLRRLEVADLCYNKLFDHYNAWYQKNLKPDNLYPQHAQIMKHFAEDHGLPLRNGLPQVSSNSFAHTRKSRLTIKDQWASHPSTDDREDHLNRLNIHTETVHTPAWALFQDVEILQQQITDKIYSTVTFKEPPEKLDISSFHQRYTAEVEKYALDKRYKNYFNLRNIKEFDVHKLENSHEVNNLDEVLTEAAIGLTYTIEGLKTDIDALEMIQKGTYPIEKFEFNGQKYVAKDAKSLIDLLKNELLEAETLLEKTDIKLITFFINQASMHGLQEKIKNDYINMFAITKESDEDIKSYVDLRSIINPVFYEPMMEEKIYAIVNQVKLREKRIKERIKEMLLDKSYTPFYTEEDRKKLEEYISVEHEYFSNSTFHENKITLFNEATYLYQSIVVERSFAFKKTLLDWQLTCLSV